MSSVGYDCDSGRLIVSVAPPVAAMTTADHCESDVEEVPRTMLDHLAGLLCYAPLAEKV